MFNQKKHKRAILCLYTEHMIEFFRDRIDAYPILEELIIAGSIKFFNDPNPCEIHRRAVQIRICEEIEETLNPNTVLPVNELPESIKSYLHNMNPSYVAIEKANHSK